MKKGFAKHCLGSLWLSCQAFWIDYCLFHVFREYRLCSENTSFFICNIWHLCHLNLVGRSLVLWIHRTSFSQSPFPHHVSVCSFTFFSVHSLVIRVTCSQCVLSLFQPAGPARLRQFTTLLQPDSVIFVFLSVSRNCPRPAWFVRFLTLHFGVTATLRT